MPKRLPLDGLISMQNTLPVLTETSYSIIFDVCIVLNSEKKKKKFLNVFFSPSSAVDRDGQRRFGRGCSQLSVIYVCGLLHPAADLVPPSTSTSLSPTAARAPSPGRQLRSGRGRTAPAALATARRRRQLSVGDCGAVAAFAVTSGPAGASFCQRDRGGQASINSEQKRERRMTANRRDTRTSIMNAVFQNDSSDFKKSYSP